MVDLSGKKHKSLAGYRYFQLTVDDWSRKKFVDFLHLKSEGMEKFQALHKKLEKMKHPAKVAVVRTDGGGEYNSNEWLEWCSEMGRELEFSAPYRTSGPERCC